jgi:hypothetical protein
MGGKEADSPMASQPASPRDSEEHAYPFHQENVQKHGAPDGPMHIPGQLNANGTKI